MVATGNHQPIVTNPGYPKTIPEGLVPKAGRQFLGWQNVHGEELLKMKCKMQRVITWETVGACPKPGPTKMFC